jgi:two-component system, NarL family, sensor histidine kinase UhpB
MNFMNRPAPSGARAGTDRRADTIVPVPFENASLRLKINLIVAALTLLFAATVLLLQLRTLRDSVHEETVSANKVAAQLLKRNVWRYAAQGTGAMLAFLQGIGRVRSNDITLYDAEGKELYRSPPSTYKAGRDAPDWFVGLIAPPPSVQSIAFPDGRLEVRSNASRAEVDAWDSVLVLVAGALVLLLVLHLGVFWLVGRAVRPFGQIVTALNALQAGRFDVALPPLSGSEAAAIGAAFNRMVGDLQRRIESETRAARAESQLSDSRELTRWIDQRIEAERRLIARELHDELGQSVTAMRSMALSIAARMHGRDAESERAARLIADESLRLYDAMHGIIPRLTPLVLDNLGLAEALRDLVERTERSQAGVQVPLDVDLGAAAIPAEASLALFRAAQEGLTNALRHGRATRIELTLRAAGGAVTLDVVDDGSGFSSGGAGARPAVTGHHGLRWLAERAESLGGSFGIGAGPDGGVRLQMRLPLSPSPAEPPTEPLLEQHKAPA